MRILPSIRHFTRRSSSQGFKILEFARRLPDVRGSENPRKHSSSSGSKLPQRWKLIREYFLLKKLMVNKNV